MTHFVSFVDKENTSHLGVLSNILPAGLQHGPVGKTFQQNSQFSAIHHPARQALKNVNTMDGLALAVSTSRKALGHLNVDPIGPQKAKQAGSKISVSDCLRPPAPASKPQWREQVHTREQPIETVGFRTEEEMYPEMENFPSYEETDSADDSFSDIFDYRVDNHVQELLNWRPSTLYHVRDININQDSLIDDHLDNSLYFNRVKDLTLEDPDVLESAEGYDLPSPLQPIEALPEDSFIRHVYHA